LSPLAARGLLVDQQDKCSINKESVMFKVILIAAVFGATIATFGCATIVHSGPRSIPIASTPPGAKVSIYDRSGNLVQASATPFVAQLNPKYGYFKGQNYRLVFEMPGYSAAEVNLGSKVSGWYLGNLVFGGLIGMLVVDPLTGAMYNLSPEKIEQPLSASQAEVIRRGTGVLVILVSQAKPNERAEMVRLN
jgi:hypothetical protein